VKVATPRTITIPRIGPTKLAAATMHGRGYTVSTDSTSAIVKPVLGVVGRENVDDYAVELV
jgi:hypothetical protein